MSNPRKLSNQSLPVWIFGSLLLLFLLFVFVFAPPTLPEFKQRLLGLFGAVFAGFFAFFITGKMGVQLTAADSRLGRIGIQATGGLAVFVLVLWWWCSSAAPVAVEKVLQRANEIEHYTKGAHYPSIRVGLYFGPTEGSDRGLNTSPRNPGFLEVSVSNTNNFPIYDLYISMWDVTQNSKQETANEFNKEFGKNLRGMEILHPDTSLTYLLPANTNAHKVGFDFSVRTRAGRTTHRIRFIVVNGRWESASSITDDLASQLIAKQVSLGYPQNLASGATW